MTLKNEGNQNNEVGLPLTLLRLRPEHEAAVLEMGMYVGGEIAELAAIGAAGDRRRDRRPAGPPVADRDDRGGRAGEGRAGRGAAPPDGVAVLNADDERVRRMAARTCARVVTYGFARRCRRTAPTTSSRLGLTGCAFTS